MTYLVTQPCCADASCVSACPVDSIHPRPDEPGFAQADMLHINPDTCIECGACVDACPVDAIRHISELPPVHHRFVALNRRYFERQEASKKTVAASVSRTKKQADLAGLRVAIVGSGPSAMYAAEHLLQHKGVQVEIYERLGAPFGLARFGLAPDHLHARKIVRHFERVLANDRVRLHLNAEVGGAVSHAQLLETHSAVIHATGAFRAKPHEVEGAALANVHDAIDFVAWYNAHPGARRLQALPDGRSAAIIGTGNVALDAARMLLLDKQRLRELDLQPDVQDALAASRFDTVYLIGRSDPLDASFSYSELQTFLELEGVDVEFHESCRAAIDAALDAREDTPLPFARAMKKELFREIRQAGVKGGSRRLVLLFNAALQRIAGDGAVERVELRVRTHGAADAANPAGGALDLPVDLVVSAIGMRPEPVADLPFDSATGTLFHDKGRVTDPATQAVVPGVYAVGWVKRGPRGVIGTNKPCSLETVDALVDDFRDKKLRALPS